MNIEIVDLAEREVNLPSDRVGVVLAQPYLELTTQEPYLCTADTKQKQLETIRKTLEISLLITHGEPKTHFTVFPEYSIPGPDGIALINNTVSADNWPNGTIVIGGTDALSIPDFTDLLITENTHFDTVHNSLDRMRPVDWINCCIIWIKREDGIVERWLQPKLWPSWPELDIQHQNMFRGQSVFAFKGQMVGGGHYLFSTIVCFDWIAGINGHKPWQWVIESLGQQANQLGADLSLSWLFVIECNPKPSHDTFLIEARNFFDQTFVRNVLRDGACLVFANSAGRPDPGSVNRYGCSSLVFAPQTLFSNPSCPPTYCNGGKRFRSNSLLSDHCDVLLRECGACIHSFAQVNPRSLRAGASGRSFPIERPFVFPLDEIDDPRAPADEVPASIKWLNDILDDLSNLSNRYPAAILCRDADTIHQQATDALRAIPAPSAAHIVELGTCGSKASHADQWDQTEIAAIEHIVHTLDIIGVAFEISDIGVYRAHATIDINGKKLDLIAIRGNTHEECAKHCNKLFSPLPHRQSLLISRDRDNAFWPDRPISFLDLDAPKLGDERKITEPRSSIHYLEYQVILDAFINAQTCENLGGEIHGKLSV